MTNGDTTTGNNLVKEPNCQAPPNETGDREPRNVSDESTAILDIASSSSGEMKISLIYNSAQGKPKFSADNVDSILKRVEDKCLQSYKVLDPNFSLKNLMKEMCECSLNLELGTDAIPPTDPPSDVDGDVSVSLAKIPKLHPHSNGVENNNYLTPDDIAKGQESVIVSLVNEVNNECLPSFHYITHNAVFQNAYVRFSLARIADDNCCPSCFGNCLTSTKPCPCALQSGGEFAYTAEGLVKEELLDECIKANRVPEKHLLSYCKECPLEKWKNEGNSHNLEACKGHFDRSFIKECWLKCGCSKSCGNRVVQRGIKHKLQVFMTPGGKGWGLRTLEDLPKGAFVCEFIGEVLTIKEFYQRVSQSSKKDEYAHPVLLDTDWGEGNEINEDEALCLDATNYGNVSRFINHRYEL